VNFTLTIPGNPIPKARPRVVKGRAYTPDRTREWEKTVSTWAGLFYQNEPSKARLKVSLRFYRKTRHKCDLDNLVKAVLDGLQGVLFVDDSQIDDIHARREVDRDSPRVEIWVTTCFR